MPLATRFDSRAGRVYFAIQAVLGAAWWIGVFSSDSIRTLTLGGLDPVWVAIADIPLFVIASALIACGLRHLVWVVTPWTALVAAGMALYATTTGQAGWGVLLMIAATAGSAAAGLLIWLGRLPTEWVLFGPFTIKVSPSATTTVHVARTSGQLIAFWGLFLAVIPVIIVLLEKRWMLEFPFPTAVRWAGLVVIIAASALGIWAAISMSTHGHGTPLPSSTARSLVIAGPYRFVRNPMAVAGIAQGVAVGLIAGSWLVVIYALAGSFVWNWIVRPLEEADLSERFGSAYDEYVRGVQCWTPRLTPFLPSSLNAR